MHRILFVCHGNICRSTMAQFVFEHLVQAAGRSHEFVIDSAATSTEELGNPPHYGTVEVLRRHNITVGTHRARQIRPHEAHEWDHIIYMDTANKRNLARILGPDPTAQITSMLSWAGRSGDVADPWYTGDFEATYADVLAGCKGLLAALNEHDEQTR